MSSNTKFTFTTNLKFEDSQAIHLRLQRAWLNVGSRKLHFPQREFYRFDLVTYEWIVPFLFNCLNEFSAKFEVKKNVIVPYLCIKRYLLGSYGFCRRG